MTFKLTFRVIQNNKNLIYFDKINLTKSDFMNLILFLFLTIKF